MMPQHCIVLHLFRAFTAAAVLVHSLAWSLGSKAGPWRDDPTSTQQQTLVPSEVAVPGQQHQAFGFVEDKFSPYMRSTPFNVLNSFRRSNDSFTQGLTVLHGTNALSSPEYPTVGVDLALSGRRTISDQEHVVTLLESSGLWGKSKVQVFDCWRALHDLRSDAPPTAATGNCATSQSGFPLPPEIFGEGIAWFPPVQHSSATGEAAERVFRSESDRWLSPQLWQLSYHSKQFFMYGVEAQPLQNATLMTKARRASMPPKRQERSRLRFFLQHRVPFPDNSFVEGWGLAARHMARRVPQTSLNKSKANSAHGPVRLLYATDGSDTVYVLQVDHEAQQGKVGGIRLPTLEGGSSQPTLTVVQRFRVVDDQGLPVRGLNDVTWDEKRQSLWACIYGTACLAQIAVPYLLVGEKFQDNSAQSGLQQPASLAHATWNSPDISHPTRPASLTAEVVSFVNLHALQPPPDAMGLNVLNGIAVDAASDTFFVTGKWWDRVYELKLDATASTRGKGLPSEKLRGVQRGFGQECRTTVGGGSIGVM